MLKPRPIPHLDSLVALVRKHGTDQDFATLAELEGIAHAMSDYASFLQSEIDRFHFTQRALKSRGLLVEGK